VYGLLRAGSDRCRGVSAGVTGEQRFASGLGEQQEADISQSLRYLAVYNDGWA
jgi:hypothetical protein